MKLPTEIAEAVADLDTLIVAPSNNDFEDEAWKDKVGIVMRRLTDTETIRLGRRLISDLGRGLSQRQVGSIFQIAFQLREPGMEYIMDELAKEGDFALEILDEHTIEVVGERVTPVEKGSQGRIAQSYAFLAASMLKMFTHPPENYEKSWLHINRGYRKFYSDPISVSGVEPKLAVLKQIHDHFAISELMKNTLYRYLYNANRTGEISSIRKYLYDMHLSHTGMHVVPIVYKICMAMNILPKDLITTIYAKRFDPQFRGLVAAFKLMVNTDVKHKRMMWKYGRIFDHNFLAPLQTRACANCKTVLFVSMCLIQGKSRGQPRNLEYSSV